MDELELKFVDKWENKIYSLGGVSSTLESIKKESGSPFVRDHLYTWLNETKNMRTNRENMEISEALKLAELSIEIKAQKELAKPSNSIECMFFNHIGMFLEEEVRLDQKIKPSPNKDKSIIPSKLKMAIKVYEINVDRKFIGGHPYQGLAKIYKKYKLDKELKKVLKSGIRYVKNEKVKEKFKTDLANL